MPKTLAVLEDIRYCCRRIADKATGVPFDRYQADPDLRDIVERNLIKIGDGLNRLRKMDASLAVRIKDFARIIDTRNHLTHGYTTVADDVIWLAATQDIHLLLNDIETLIGEQGVRG